MSQSQWRSSGFHRGAPAHPPKSSSTSGIPDRDIREGLTANPLQWLDKPTPFPKDICIKDLVYIGSYNWVEAQKPTIIIPGSPPVWSNRTMPFTVQRDSSNFIDQNGYRVPSKLLLPIFVVADVIEEDTGIRVDWESVDIVTDRNGLRKLLRWIHDTDGSAREFRIDTQLAGKKTVLFNRWEKRYIENDEAHWSWGHNFEKESTNLPKGCGSSTGHHRIVIYDLNGLKIVVRYEVDACLPRATPAAKPKSSKSKSDTDDLLADLESLSVSNSSASQPTSSHNGIDIISAGSPVEQSDIIELTTRSAKRVVDFDWVDAYPQLFLSQTPNHFLAAHTQGRFQTVTKRNIKDPALKEMEQKLQDNFKKLRAALTIIQTLVVEHGQRGRLTLVCQQGLLKVYERISQASCLPDEILARFEA